MVSPHIFSIIAFFFSLDAIIYLERKTSSKHIELSLKKLFGSISSSFFFVSVRALVKIMIAGETCCSLVKSELKI